MSGRDTFDAVADRYDAELAKGLSATGEDKDYFARGRVAWLAQRLGASRAPVRVLDFGCGTGSAARHLRAAFPAAMLRGVDPSAASVLEATRRYGARERAEFSGLDAVRAGPDFDVAFCNGVFHHIPVGERSGAVEWVFARLGSGGLFALFENNPWNPGTRYVMSRIPFDRDAVMLWPSETRLLLAQAGFEIVETAYLFFFPHALRVLRPAERWLERVPAGGQYVTLARKP
jgi:SAM-dependent methyltransferase